MTKYGTIFSYWSKDWDTDYMQVLRNAAKSDINCIEFHTNRTMDWSQNKIDDFVALAKDLDIEILMNGGVEHEEITYSDDPAVRHLGINKITSYLTQASRLGAKFFDGGYAEGWPSAPKVPLTAELKQVYTERVIGSIGEMVKVADSLGITMSMEIVNRFEAFLVNTAKEARYIAERVDHPNFKVTMDTYHMNIEEDSIEEAIQTLGKKYLGHVHLGESNRKLPGQGSQVDWDKVFNGLKSVGYSERLLLEPFTKAFGTIGNSVFLWRDLSNNAGEEQLIKEMKESVAFVKTKYEK
ncbi:MAG: sugar phosphate isomerase/epimerase family protein [Eubacteriales bacterium]